MSRRTVAKRDVLATNSPGYGKFIAEWKQFSRHDGWNRGILIGSAKDGKLLAFIPDPETRQRPEFTGTSAAEGVAADAARKCLRR